MRCPFCTHPDSRVIDSREAQDGAVIRRRRECPSCEHRFTTYEKAEALLPAIVKKDGRREPFDREKLLAGLKRACEKRPISAAQLESLVDDVERALQEKGEAEVPSTAVGGALLAKLEQLDPVAYMRFASVYLSFKDASDFVAAYQNLLAERSKAPKGDKS
jgi:transcriptional repressor NrdR